MLCHWVCGSRHFEGMHCLHDAVPLGVWLPIFWRTPVPSWCCAIGCVAPNILKDRSAFIVYWGYLTLKMEALQSTKTSAALTKQQCHIPEDSDLQQHRCENLKPHTYYTVPLLHEGWCQVSPTQNDCTWLTIKISNITLNLKWQYHTTRYHNTEHPSCPCAWQLQNIKSLHLPEHPATLTVLSDTLTAIHCILQVKSQSVCYWQKQNGIHNTNI